MSYRDPYADPYYSHGQTQARQQTYHDSDAEFNPYTTDTSANQNQHYRQPTYDEGYNNNGGGYDVHYGNDAYAQPRAAPGPAPGASGAGGVARQATMRSFLTGDDPHTLPRTQKSVPPLPERKETADSASGFEQGEFATRKDFSNFKGYRSTYRESLWTKGGRGSCVGRFCCCSIMIMIYLIISVFLALLLWVRPPAITIQEAGAMPGQQLVQPTDSGITVSLGVNLTISNPNYFGLNFRNIKAQIFYPINDTPIGGGESKNVKFPSHSHTNFTFPFAIDYKTSLDPRGLILQDLLSKCGATKSDVTFNYKITLGINILFLPISPSVSNSFTFLCPLDASDLGGLGGK